VTIGRADRSGHMTAAPEILALRLLRATLHGTPRLGQRLGTNRSHVPPKPPIQSRFYAASFHIYVVQKWAEIGLDASSCAAMEAPFGPDGLPAVFVGDTWYSHDRSFWWNGTDWVPAAKESVAGPWLMRIGTVVVLVALLGYVVYTTVSTSSEFALGYFVGVVLFFVVLVVVYRFAGRWGGFGAVVRAGTIFLALLKVLTLLTHRPSF